MNCSQGFDLKGSLLVNKRAIAKYGIAAIVTGAYAAGISRKWQEKHPKMDTSTRESVAIFGVSMSLLTWLAAAL